MSPQYRFARVLGAGLFALTAIATGLVGGSNGASAEPAPVYNGRVLMERCCDEATRGLYTIRPDGEEIHDVDLEAVTGASFVNNDTEVAYDFGHAIWQMNADGTNKHEVIPPDIGWPLWASWSPDSSRFVYSSVAGDQLGLAMRNADGSGFHIVTGSPARWTRWSPDGTRLVFESGTDIWIVNADGTNEHQVLEFAYDFDDASTPSFSPDGSKIVFTFTPNRYEQDPRPYPDAQSLIYVVGIDGSDGHVVGPLDGANSVPLFSPDGASIVFTRSSTDVPQGLFTMAADGSNVVRLTTGGDHAIDWQSLDGPLPPSSTTTSAPTSTSTSTSTTIPNQPPLPKFTFKQAKPHYVIASGANSTDPDGTIVSYEWRWGDGSPASTTKQTWHQYKRSGWALIRLTVTDNRGDSTTRAIWCHVN